MINQELLNYIEQQLNQGASRDQITSSLISNGWQSQDIEEGFLAVIDSSSVSNQQNQSGQLTLKLLKILGLLTVTIIIGIGIFLAYQKNLKFKDGSQASNQSPSENNEASQANQFTEQNQESDMEIIFADMLNSCSEYESTFTHPLTGDVLKKEISGVVNGKCSYVEQMPNNGKMECQYTESERKTMAQYYKDIALADTIETSLNTSTGSGEQKTTYTIDGNIVDNPLEELINSGVCKISGY